MRNNFLLMLIFLQLDKMMEEKKAAMKDEADLGFTVIRVESSVSQLAEADEADDVSGVTSAAKVEEDEQEEEAVSATETETKTEVDTTTSELDSR